MRWLCGAGVHHRVWRAKEKHHYFSLPAAMKRGAQHQNKPAILGIFFFAASPQIASKSTLFRRRNLILKRRGHCLDGSLSAANFGRRKMYFWYDDVTRRKCTAIYVKVAQKFCTRRRSIQLSLFGTTPFNLGALLVIFQSKEGFKA